MAKKEKIEELFLASLGLLISLKEKADKTLEGLLKKGDITKEHLISRGKEAKKEIEKIVEKKVEEIHERLNLATKADIEELSKRISALEKKIK